MKLPSGCRAQQFVNQMRCEKCGLTWDVDDEDPPKCDKETPKRREYETPECARINGGRML